MKKVIMSAIAAMAVTSSQAAIYSLSGVIDGAQEVPASGATGTGNILGSYDDVTNDLIWGISFSGLTGPSTGIHFHGPAGPGANAGVQVNIGAISGLSSPTAGNTIISEAQEADLLAGLWYVNIHTQANAAGEIRGQVTATAVPEPSAGLLALLGLGLCARRKR